MVVEKAGKDGGESGQSVLEFMLMLPMLVGLVVILIRVNTAIQVSIVDQQYARAHTLFLSFNSPVYPLLGIRERELTAKQYNQMVIGVSANAPGPGSYQPEAATQYIARKKGVADNKGEIEPAERALVRIHDTVTLCTQPNVVKAAGGSYVPILELGPGPAYVPKGSYRTTLTESTRFDYCRAPIQYVMNDGGDQ